MTMRILVIDDELGRLPHKRNEFLDRWDLSPASGFSRVVECTFITSQHHRSHDIENDASLAVAHVANNPESWALVLLDMQFDDGPLLQGEPTRGNPNFGLRIQEMLEQAFPTLPIVQFTAQAQKDLERQDGLYLSKIDGCLDDLRLLLVERGRCSLEEKKLLLGVPVDTVVGSEVMVKLYARVYRMARTDTPLLIRGETGTGKEHLAKYFHVVSLHRSGPWVTRQVSVSPPNLYESELFGHEKGAFTGADSSHVGEFERADAGTIFLDEIGALPAELQAKLLRVIGERTFRRVGGKSELKVKCGIVAATQDDLEANAFRKDLLARFRTVVVPPLHERPQELLTLAQHFLAESQRKAGKRGMSFSAATRETLTSHHFVDNARGLFKAVENAVEQLSSNSVVQPLHLDLASPARNAPADSSDRTDPGVRSAMSPMGELTGLMSALHGAEISVSVDTLRGALNELDVVTSRIRQELAYAALQCCRHPVTRKIKVQPAMQLLTSNPELSPTNAKRKLNELLGRKQGEALDLIALDLQLKQREMKNYYSK